MYTIVPIPTVSEGARNADIKQRRANEEKHESSKREEKHGQDKNKMHSELISVNKEAIIADKKNTENINGAISLISKQLTGLSLEVPELVEGEKIAKSITDNSQNIEKVLKDLIRNVGDIKLEEKSINFTPYVKALSEVLNKNTVSLKAEISKLSKSVEGISLEQEERPMEWVFDVQRNDKGYIDKVIATVPYYGDEDGG